MYRFLEHTADVCVECRGETFAALLQSATDALYAITLSNVQSGAEAYAVEKNLSLKANSRDEALVRWLQELIFLLETEGFVAGKVIFSYAEAEGVEAVVIGYQCRSDERTEEVKSATYHGLNVTQDSDGFVVQIIFDL